MLGTADTIDGRRQKRHRDEFIVLIRVVIDCVGHYKEVGQSADEGCYGSTRTRDANRLL